MRSNTIVMGLLMGIIFPAFGFLVLQQLFALLESQGAASGSGFSENFRERTLGIVAIALNLIPLNLFRRRRQDLSMRGVVVATGALALVWLVFYGKTLLG
jgi:amino acid permease